jgi:hypothetical protein
MRIRYVEQHLAERIEAAQKRAEMVRSGQNADTEEQVIDVLKYVISRHYSIPFFDKYFDDRTIDELFFEAALVSPKTPEANIDYASKVTKEAKEELVTMFDEWIDANPELEAADPFDDIAKNFMETGEFAQETKQEES